MAKTRFNNSHAALYDQIAEDATARMTGDTEFTGEKQD
jgi:hypothetical protein